MSAGPRLSQLPPVPRSAIAAIVSTTRGAGPCARTRAPQGTQPCPTVASGMRFPTATSEFRADDAMPSAGRARPMRRCPPRTEVARYCGRQGGEHRSNHASTPQTLLATLPVCGTIAIASPTLAQIDPDELGWLQNMSEMTSPSSYSELDGQLEKVALDIAALEAEIGTLEIETELIADDIEWTAFTRLEPAATRVEDRDRRLHAGGIRARTRCSTKSAPSRATTNRVDVELSTSR